MFEGDVQDFTLHVPHHTLARFLVHAELLSRTPPGNVVDIGVGCGGSTFAFAKLLRILRRPGTVFGFDTFSGFPHVGPQDGNDSLVKVGGLNFGPAPLIAASKNAGLPIQFIIGDITQTVPEWVQSRASDFHIALLNLDADLYEPTAVALEHLMPLMAPGGVVILDEYDVNAFPGERRAVDAYFQKRGGVRPILHQHSWVNNPSRYFYT